MQSSYFSTIQKETVERVVDTNSNSSDDEWDDQTEISEGRLLNNAENDNSPESFKAIKSSFRDESTDPFSVYVKTFQERNCGCSYGRNKEPHSKSLHFQDVVEHRMQCIELTAELDLVIMASIQSETKATSSRKPSQTNYLSKGQVSWNRFPFLHGVGKEHLSNLKKHLWENGLVARQHGNTLRLPRNVLSQDALQRSITFITNFASE